MQWTGQILLFLLSADIKLLLEMKYGTARAYKFYESFITFRINNNKSLLPDIRLGINFKY